MRGIDAQAGFDFSLGDGQSVVKLRRAGEISHAKCVKPLKRTRFALAINDDFDSQLPRVHRRSIAPVLIAFPRADPCPEVTDGREFVLDIF